MNRISSKTPFHLKWMKAIQYTEEFKPFPLRDTTPVTSSLLQQTHSEKWVYSIWKEFAPSGSKFFPHRVDPFLAGDRTIFMCIIFLK